MKRILLFCLLAIVLLNGCSKPEINSEKKKVGEVCLLNSDCELPPRYGLSSYGPHDPKCINNKCEIVVDLVNKCQKDSECDCSSYDPPNLPKEYKSCSCIEKTCMVIVKPV